MKLTDTTSWRLGVFFAARLDHRMYPLLHTLARPLPRNISHRGLYCFLGNIIFNNISGKFIALFP